MHINPYNSAEIHIAIIAIYLFIYKDETMYLKDNNALLY